MKKTIEETYQKKTQLEHILLRPDTYIGSTESNHEIMNIFEDKKIIKKLIIYCPGLYKIFDEVLVNARDAGITDKKTYEIRVMIYKDHFIIINKTKGAAIPIKLHKEEKMYVPELIFGHLLTGSNFDDNEKRTTGGRNGFGAKLANIFSNKFIVECCDKKKTFKQEFRRNMSWKKAPIIEDNKSLDGYVSITVYPDFEKFKLKEINEDMIKLFIKRVYDVAGTMEKINIYINDELIEQNTFKKYIGLYYDDENLVYEKINEEWQIGIKYIPDNNFQQYSFVNGINTFNGGTHVKYITDPIIDRIITSIKKKKKDLKIKPSIIKENLVIFVNSVIENPQFSSQTKEELKSKSNTFGSEGIVSDKTIKKLISFGIIDQILAFIRAKEESSLINLNKGKKQSKIIIPKLEDANFAGTKHSDKCILILTEGDSAKALAMSGRSSIENGNDIIGIFPLKGKLLNVREASTNQLKNNDEINNVCKIVGLKYGKVYENINDLRYGKIILFTDQDSDGFHIKGLLINFIHYFWPSLLKNNNFIYSLATPIVKATKGKTVKEFYNIPDYEKWKKRKYTKSWNIKYYKGLGTSTSKDAKEYFKDFNNKIILYYISDEVNDVGLNIDEDSILLAFQKIRSDDRKSWLSNILNTCILDIKIKKVRTYDFVHKELILFSNDDNSRSLPSICDGLKTSQRKIIYGVIKRKLFSKNNELKVSQLAGYVSDITSYHHGEASLLSTIVKMAQNYVGSNNINLLYPNGSFGTRLMGGTDNASARYLYTFASPILRKIFREEDDPILNYLNDDGDSIEPDTYHPTLCMALINGAEGIGTGYSTSIPCHNPLDIVENIFNLMDGKEQIEMKPWYKNFEGKIFVNSTAIKIVGNYEISDGNTIEINELPIGLWTTPYKQILDSITYNSGNNKDIITEYTDKCTDTKVEFTVTFPGNKLDLFVRNDTLEQKLKLIKTLTTTNMHLFNHNKEIKKYENTNEILKEWYEHRLIIYIKRKNYIIGRLIKDLITLKYKVMFIEYVLSKKIIIYNQKKQDIIDKIIKYEIPKLSNNDNIEYNIIINNYTEQKSTITLENIDNVIDFELMELLKINDEKSYDYITNIPLFHLTEEKINELNEKYKNKEEELKDIIKTSEIDIWKKELEEFVIEYKKFLKL